MPLILLALIVIGLLVIPGFWVKRVLKQNSNIRKDLGGTGGELAKHLIERFKLEGVLLEETERGDHYDPDARAIRLTQPVMNGQSLTAIATAAHEFGHALQHHKEYKPLTTRTFMAKQAMVIQNVASLSLLLLPFMSMVPGLAVFARVMLIFIVASMFITSFIHFVTLPVEFDASFGRALPILKEGNYVSNNDLMACRKILLACALTYVSQAMMGVLNIGRWLRFLKR